MCVCGLLILCSLSESFPLVDALGWEVCPNYLHFDTKKSIQKVFVALIVQFKGVECSGIFRALEIVQQQTHWRMLQMDRFAAE
jgi:hypothetical protein